MNGLTATRVTVAIEAGKAVHLDTVEGKTLEFKCQGGARCDDSLGAELGDIFAASRIKCLLSARDFKGKLLRRRRCTRR